MPRISRRADVRATAARLFREHGYSSATMDLLADEVGLNKGTLYHYYPASAVDERPVVEVGLGQDLALLVVLVHVGPRLPVALLEQRCCERMT
jgi:AcrR family transcriptional regulator